MEIVVNRFVLLEISNKLPLLIQIAAIICSVHGTLKSRNPWMLMLGSSITPILLSFELHVVS